MRVYSASFTVVLTAVTLLAASCSRPTEATSTASAPLLPEGALVFDFSQDDIGTVPDGFTAALTGDGEPGEWRVQQVENAPSGNKVLTQFSDDPTNARYPHVVLDSFTARDVDLFIRFKTISGEVDASGGLVFRYQNPDNYYVVRANALEGNVVAYKTENGKRRNIGVKGKSGAYGVEATVPHHAWNTLRIIMKGAVIEVFLNERKLFEVEDDTFNEAGTVGLWTKADAVTQFDDLTIKAL